MLILFSLLLLAVVIWGLWAFSKRASWDIAFSFNAKSKPQLPAPDGE